MQIETVAASVLAGESIQPCNRECTVHLANAGQSELPTGPAGERTHSYRFVQPTLMLPAQVVACHIRGMATAKAKLINGPAAKRAFALNDVYRLLEPGPVLLVSTAVRGRPNVMPMSWHTMMEFEPPLVGCVISSDNYTFEVLRATGECGLNIPTVELGRKVVACGNCSGRDADKFVMFGLTAVPATVVKAPLVKECYAQLECRVVDRSLMLKYNFFVLEVLKAWVDPRHKKPKPIFHLGKGVFMLPGRTIRIRSPKTSLV